MSYDKELLLAKFRSTVAKMLCVCNYYELSVDEEELIIKRGDEITIEELNKSITNNEEVNAEKNMEKLAKGLIEGCDKNFTSTTLRSLYFVLEYFPELQLKDNEYGTRGYSTQTIDDKIIQWPSNIYVFTSGSLYIFKRTLGRNKNFWTAKGYSCTYRLITKVVFTFWLPLLISTIALVYTIVK